MTRDEAKVRNRELFSLWKSLRAQNPAASFAHHYRLLSDRYEIGIRQVRQVVIEMSWREGRAA